jgi:hypothetical protein
MFATRLGVGTAVLLVSVLGLLAQTRERPTAKQGEKPANVGRPGERGGQAATVSGVVSTVDTAKNTLTLTVAGRSRGETEEKTFSVPKDAEILLDAGRGRFLLEEGKLGDLSAGVRVVLTLTANGKAVESIHAEGPSFQGVVKGVDTDKSTITLTLNARGRGDEGEEKTFTLDKKAEIVLDDGRGRRTSFKEGKLADVTAGCLATVKLSVNQKTANSVLAGAPTIYGIVKSVDGPKGTITLTLGARGRGEEAEEKTWSVAKDADVLLGNLRGGRGFARGGKLADLPAGAVASLRLSLDQKNAVLIQADGPTVYGTLDGVDAGKGTITVLIGAGRGSDGEKKTFTLAKKARVMQAGQPIKLGDLKVTDDTRVSVKLSLDQKSAQAVVVFTEEARRERER